MPKDRQQVNPIREVNSTEALNRFVTELNTKLETISNRLPSLTTPIAATMRQDQGELMTISQERSRDIPTLNTNPVDLNALKNDLSTNVLPTIQSELSDLRDSVKNLARILRELSQTLTD
jgi:hypothetical protein